MRGSSAIREWKMANVREAEWLASAYHLCSGVPLVFRRATACGGSVSLAYRHLTSCGRSCGFRIVIDTRISVAPHHGVRRAFCRGFRLRRARRGLRERGTAPAMLQALRV
jgi:hypothetical protein